jgi:hypothetical protein
MFDPKSRYAGLPTTTINVIDPDGQTREVRYVTRRFLPDPQSMTTLIEHTVAQGDRLDLIATKYLGDPLVFWRICDANNVLRPEELIEQPGRIIDIALPNP